MNDIVTTEVPATISTPAPSPQEKPGYLPGAAESAAVSLLKFGVPVRSEEDTQSIKAMEKMLLRHALHVENGDYTGMAQMLSCQAQMLHGIFAQVIEKYAEEKDASKKLHLYSQIALHAQSSCRMTVKALTQIKKPIG